MEAFNDTLTASTTSKALTHNFSIEEKERRAAAEMNKDFYYDKGDKYIDPVTVEVDIAVVNLVRVLIKKRTSLLYREELVREYDGPAASAAFIDNLYQDLNIDKFLLSVDIMAELTGTGLVHIAQDDDNESGIKLLLYDGGDISVVANPEDPNIAEAVSLIRVYDKIVNVSGSEHVDRVVEQQIWTDTSLTIYQTGSSGSKPIMQGTESHNLPVMPFVAFKGEDVEGQYLGHSSATNWRKLNDTYNRMITNLGYMIKMQSATPIVLSGFESGEGIMVHPGRAINIPAGASAGVLDFNPKIGDTLEAVKYIEDQIYNTSSVPKVTVVGGKASSGRELMIQWFPLLQVFKEKQVRYQRYELNLANTILNIVGLPELKNILVKYPEQSVLPMSAEEDTLDNDIKLNIKTPIDELMRRKPSLSEAEAEATILANKEFNKNITSLEDTDNGRRD